jgi:hypothetical protein
MRRLAMAAFGVAVGAAFYLLLVDTVSFPEPYVMCAVGLLAGIAYALSSEQGPRQTIRASWLLRAWRVLAGLPLHIALVCRDAVVQPFSGTKTRGEFRVVPFRGGDSPGDRGRRALTESLGSFAPNTIVIGIDAERELLLVHQLHRQGDRDDLDVLGLG